MAGVEAPGGSGVWFGRPEPTETIDQGSLSVSNVDTVPKIHKSF